MDEISEKITQILNNPDSMEMVKNLAGSLISSGDESGNKSTKQSFDGLNNIGDIANLLNGLGEKDNAQNDLPLSPSQISMFLKVVRILKSKKDDDKTRLISALKPHLSEKRQKKADTAIKMMKLIDVLPLLKECGLFDMF